jgi:5-methylcytosine-specific restriction protein A
MRRTGPDQKTAQLVTSRHHGFCLRCRCRPGSQIHHRRPRALGGSHDPLTNGPANLAWLCHICHADIESNRSEAYAFGWSVRHGLDEPYQVPLTDLAGRMFFLSEEGDVIELAGANEAPF